MKERQSKLLYLLQTKKTEYVLGTYLSEKLGVSVRTIRNDIKELNESLLIDAVIESNNRYGYKLTGSLEKFQEKDHQHFEERSFYIIKTLMERDGYTVYSELADQIYYSSRTIRLDIQKISLICKEKYNGVYIEAKPFHGVRLIGAELEKRALLEGMIQKKNATEEEIIRSAYLMFREWYSKEEIANMLNMIKNEIYDRQMTVSLNILDQILVHLLITRRRIEKGYIVDISEVKEGITTAKEQDLADRIATYLEDVSGIAVPETERKYLIIYLLSKKIGNWEWQNNALDIEQDEMLALISSSLEKLAFRFGYPLLEDEQLLMGLYYHVSKAIYPMKYRLEIENPFIEKIKTQYLQAYHMAVYFSQNIQEQMMVVIEEEEIGFIALHIQSALERLDEKKFMEIAIVCSSGVATSSLLKQKIEKRFREMKVQGLYSVDNVSFIPEHIKVIVSTVPLEVKDKKVIVVHEFLEEQDLLNIKDNVYLTLFSELMEDQKFAILDAESKEDLIHQALTHFNMEDFEESILQRELLSTTDVGNGVALPHPMTSATEETSIYAVINKKEILWGKSSVRLILFLFLKEDDHLQYEQLFRELYHLIISEKKLEAIFEAESFDDYIHVLK
ncbi:BglG family transcription antiterminator [Metabacillus arenae]|uniref:BglG family transcription antiterminator n=1 Tax=Metabacillus arenae TaxID=2771434 RepID=A0A926NEV9_9BACI|nr:BglG family transcription antiterminator [Metabacillus arenae]MBD1382957.1 BglG family transcription antiterminator [Metabacillus arenae]